MGIGAEEYRRVLTVALRFVALVAILFYGARVDVARGFVGTAIPLATALTLLGRFRARKWLHARRARGHALRRVLAVGTIEAATDLTQHLGRAMHAGFTVVGVCIPGPVGVLWVDEVDVPVLGSPDDVMVALKASQADVLAVAGEGALPPDACGPSPGSWKAVASTSSWPPRSPTWPGLASPSGPSPACPCCTWRSPD